MYLKREICLMVHSDWGTLIFKTLSKKLKSCQLVLSIQQWFSFMHGKFSFFVSLAHTPHLDGLCYCLLHGGQWQLVAVHSPDILFEYMYFTSHLLHWGHMQHTIIQSVHASVKPMIQINIGTTSIECCWIPPNPSLDKSEAVTCHFPNSSSLSSQQKVLWKPMYLVPIILNQSLNHN